MTDFRELWLLQFAQNLAWLPPPSLAGRLSGYLAATVPQQSLHLSPRATAPHSLCRTHAWAQSPHSEFFLSGPSSAQLEDRKESTR